MKPRERQIANVSTALGIAWNTMLPLSAMSPRDELDGIKLIDAATSAVKKAFDHYNDKADELTNWEPYRKGASDADS